MGTNATLPPVRPVRLHYDDAQFDHRDDGSIRVRSTGELGAYPRRLTDRFEHWAQAVPDRTFIAERTPGDDWRRISYGEARSRALAIGAALVERGLSAERPVLILSGNSVNHALLALGCLYAGIPYAPISPPYSTASTSFDKLDHIVRLTTPGLIFAESGSRFAAAIRATVPDSVELVVAEAPPAGRETTLFGDLTATPGAAIDAAHRAVGPDTIAKFLFTSGSTGLPKAVINTHRMICANQAMIAHNMAFLADEPPVLVDWLPWNHTFGGNKNVGITIYHGGTLYIDDGAPTPAGMARTARNLKEIAPTIYFNVPKGFEMLFPYLRQDTDLAHNFFSRLRLVFPGGAGLSQQAADELDAISVAVCGERIMMLAGLGATETAPYGLAVAPGHAKAGHVGLPAASLDLKLLSVDGKLEARLKGPSITPGYWRQPEQTRAAFDEEGFYRLGDALRFVDPEQPQLGFKFDGRIAEDFKLASGTWVSVGPLRARMLEHFAPLLADVVFAGLNEDELTALMLVNAPAAGGLNPALGPNAPLGTVVADPVVRAAFTERLDSLSRLSTGGSTRIARAILLDTPPSLDAGEVTDKGSINQRAVRAHRAVLVAELYTKPYSDRVLSAKPAR